MKRRKYLGTAALGIAGLAGCTTGTNPESTPANTQPTQSPTATEAETPTDTPPDTDAESSPTETGPSWQSSIAIRDIIQHPTGEWAISNPTPDGNHHFIWISERHGTAGELYHLLIDSLGDPVSEATRLTTHPGKTQYPRLSLDDDGTCQVMFTDGRGDGRAFYHLSVSPDGTASTPTRLVPRETHGQLVNLDANLHVIRKGPPNADELIEKWDKNDDRYTNYEEMRANYHVEDEFFNVKDFVVDRSGSVIGSSTLATGRIKRFISGYRDHDRSYEKEFFDIDAVGDGSNIYVTWLEREQKVHGQTVTATASLEFRKATVNGSTVSITESARLGEVTMSRPYEKWDALKVSEMAYSQGYIHLMLYSDTYLRLAENGEKWSEREIGGQFISNDEHLFVVTDHTSTPHISEFSESGFTPIATAPDNVEIGAVNEHRYPLVLHVTDGDRLTISSLTEADE